MTKDTSSIHTAEKRIFLLRLSYWASMELLCFHSLMLLSYSPPLKWPIIMHVSMNIRQHLLSWLIAVTSAWPPRGASSYPIQPSMTNGKQIDFRANCARWINGTGHQEGASQYLSSSLLLSSSAWPRLKFCLNPGGIAQKTSCCQERPPVGVLCPGTTLHILFSLISKKIIAGG